MEKSTFIAVYYSYLTMFISMQIGFGIFMIVKLISTVLASNKDILKAIQGWLYSSVGFGDIVMNGGILIDPKHIPTYVQINSFDYGFAAGFHMSNPISWIIIMTHMEGYYKMRKNDLDYRVVKTQLRKNEI